MSAAFFKINFPTLVEPVIETFFTILEEMSSFDTCSGSPDRRLTTPGGMPASFITFINSITAPGVITSGFTITEHPAANAVEIFLEANIIGKFQGISAATTPTG